MVEIRDGERIAGMDGLGVTLLADIEQFGAVEVHSEPAGHVPPLHLHPRHAEAIFVIEGELTLRLEDREHRVGPETWVFVPPQVVHTFSVTSGDPARFLDVHVPSFGFGDFVRRLQAARSEADLTAARAAFDQQPPPEYASGDPGLVVIAGAGAGSGVGSTEPPGSGGAGFAGAGAGSGEKITDKPGRRATILVDADELIVSEFVYGGGQRGAQPHVHLEHADAFLVLEGEFTFHVRDRTFSVGAGTFVLFPPNVVHGFDNDSSETARCFNFHMPASGFGEYLRGRNPDFDQHDPPADGGADPSSAVLVRLSE
jgi:quercetin dioxygenase-like cupin family protein